MKNKTKGYILTLLAGSALMLATINFCLHGLALIWAIFSWYYYSKALQDRDANFKHK